jgi:hypothetical protein
MPQAGTETFGIQAFEHRSGRISTSESSLPEILGFSVNAPKWVTTRTKRELEVN